MQSCADYYISVLTMMFFIDVITFICVVRIIGSKQINKEILLRQLYNIFELLVVYVKDARISLYSAAELCLKKMGFL